MDDTREKAVAIIVDLLGCEASQATDDAPLVEGLGADSLDIVEMTMMFEDEFHIEITDDDAERFNRMTVGEIAIYLNERRAA